MTDEELNKRIHEITGTCYHSWGDYRLGYQPLYICLECGAVCKERLRNIDFVNIWEGFGILCEFMRKHKQFEEFITKYGSYEVYPIKPPYVYCLPIVLISPLAFAKAVVEFFEEK